jgi:uncharacterized protein
MEQTLQQPAYAPTVSGRISSLDIIRGISLLGILLMNIVGFGLHRAYFDASNNGGSTGADLGVWWMNMLFFEGTMRGMFSLLFGAGILLFLNKPSKSIQEGRVIDLFFRRLLWMLLFGVIHCYVLLWDGEILYTYAIVGMFAYSFRHMAPKMLLWAAVIILMVPTILDIRNYSEVRDTFEKAPAVKAVMDKGGTVSKEDSAIVAKWQGKINEEKLTPAQLKEEMDARSQGYWSVFLHKIPLNQYMQTTFLYRINFWDTLAMMLWGMAFLKLGILKAVRSKRFYLMMVFFGYGIGVAINYIEASYIVEQQFTIPSFYRMFITYNLGRIPTTCGHIGLIMLFVQSGWLSFLQKSLAAVGQMAFTNYIMHSLICNFIFLGYGLAMFGKLQRHELYYIVAGIWLFQLIISPIWLNYFRFGPLEWLWRSLTYWKVQPFKRSAEVTNAETAQVPA